MGLLENSVVIVTGGAGGIGRAYCKALAHEGAAVVIADLVGAPDLVEEIEEHDGRAMSVITDVTDISSTEQLASATVQEFGRIDGLINNAAFYLKITQGPLEELSPEEWDLCMAVNVKGTWLCSRAVAPVMKGQNRGSIINIASMVVNDGTPGFLHYVASKSAIWGLTRSMAKEFGPFGVRVNTLTPDYIPHDKDYDEKNPGVDDMIKSRRCLNRTMEPEDMVGTMLYLISDLSGFTTGQNIWVNGGSGFH